MNVCLPPPFLCLWSFASMYVCVPCACLIPMEARKMKSYPLELKVVDDYELPCGCRGSNPGPLAKQLVCLTLNHLSSPQLLHPCRTPGMDLSGWPKNEEKTDTQR